MKCVKNEKTGQVERLTDEKAAERVKQPDWHYTTKSVWRNFLKGK